jgi:mono/diheme cytochrome c family protein
MFRVKLLIVFVFASVFAASCVDSKPKRYMIADSKTYEASLFRQNCAICHGTEADGKTLDDGKQIPNLREGAFKYTTDSQIYDHIANGGNGMIPFRNQLSEREMKMLVQFVQKDLRGK